jgi:hypothetical protein
MQQQQLTDTRGYAVAVEFSSVTQSTHLTDLNYEAIQSEIFNYIYFHVSVTLKKSYYGSLFPM